LFKEDKEAGVSIHFVEVGIDTGPIVVQKKINITAKDTFRTVVEKNYSIASAAMLEAIGNLENGGENYFSNNEKLATYNTVPTLREAIEFRKRRVF